MNEQHETSVSYEDEGSFSASLWAAHNTDQRGGGKKRYMIFSSPQTTLNADDHLERKGTMYRVIWARNYTRHTEALIEEEDMPA